VGLQNANAFQDNTNVSGATRNLNLLLLPGDVAFKVGESRPSSCGTSRITSRGANVWKISTIWCHSEPPGLEKRPIRTTSTRGHINEDDIAFLVGVQFGENKKKGDWSLLANYRQTGLGAVDPNLNDSTSPPLS
jgi:hypothetical protein